jgi:hypothetical protein
MKAREVSLPILMRFHMIEIKVQLMIIQAK